MWFETTALVLFLFQKTDYGAEGIKALEARKYDSAAQLFGKAVEADPKDYTAHFHLALSYSLLEQDANAISEYKKTLELKPGLYEAELNLGMLLLRQKQPAQAMPFLSAAAEAKPKESRPRFYLAESLLASGEPGKAEEQYRIALGLDGKSAPAHLGLGRSAARQNRLPEAAEHFRKAAELDPAYKDALLELAALFEKNGQTQEAISIYQNFPENVAAQERLGELLVESKQYREAIPRLEKAVQADPTPANRLALATAYRLNNEPEKSLPLLEKIVASDPTNYDLRMTYGRALRDQKQYMPAAKEFHQAVKLKPKSKEAWNELAGMLILLESYPQALAALDRVKQLGEETAANHYFRAIVLDKIHEYKPALESYERFLAASEGRNPDEEFKARQRVRIIRKELSKR